VHILIIEDETKVANALRAGLEAEHYEVTVATTGEEGFFLANQASFDLLLLDLMLPRRDGIDVLATLRKRGIQTPIFVLTAKDTVEDRVVGLDQGADDYLTKPFAFAELLARIRALLRRARLITEPGEAGGFERGRLKMDFGTYEAFIDGHRLEMTLREFELLRFFVQHPLRVYTREQLLDLVWGRDTFVEPRTVDVHVRRLRRHIERDDANPELILTVRSVGYRFNPETLG
jgi:DNA-binding response OmpR family regulator